MLSPELNSTAMHVQPQVMHVRAQVDSYHLHTDYPE